MITKAQSIRFGVTAFSCGRLRPKDAREMMGWGDGLLLE